MVQRSVIIIVITFTGSIIINSKSVISSVRKDIFQGRHIFWIIPLYILLCCPCFQSIKVVRGDIKKKILTLSLLSFYFQYLQRQGIFFRMKCFFSKQILGWASIEFSDEFVECTLYKMTTGRTILSWVWVKKGGNPTQVNWLQTNNWQINALKLYAIALNLTIFLG